MTQIAVIWTRFGPYHLARLREAGRFLSERGLEVVGLEVAGQDSVYQWELAAGSDSFTRRTVFAEANYGELGARRIQEGVQAALTEIDPCAVAINGWSVPEARAALGWCRRRRRLSVLMSESKFDETRRVWWKEAVKRRIVRRFGAALVGGAPHRDYVVRLGLDPEQVFLGYDAVDNGYFRTQAEDVRRRASELRTEYGLPELYFYVNTRFLPRKNIDGLLRAFRQYRQQSSARAWSLVITGSGETESDVKALARQLGLDAAVHWPGFVQYRDLPVYYGLAAAFIHPAKAEPWGLVVNEAAASGLPLLISRTVGSRYELVRAGVNGLLFDPCDDGALAEGMLKIAALGETERSEMGDASRQIAATYGPERFAQGLWSAIQTADLRAGSLA